jgi:phosphatidylethanolamine/phosphatidyl-N-methylethanolamine N-methyltransferase
MTTSSETADIQRRIYRRWAPVYDFLYAVILRQAQRLLAKRASAHGGDVLEIGVGTGLGLSYYDPARKLIGVDISEEMLARA